MHTRRRSLFLVATGLAVIFGFRAIQSSGAQGVEPFGSSEAAASRMAPWAAYATPVAPGFPAREQASRPDEPERERSLYRPLELQRLPEGVLPDGLASLEEAGDEDAPSLGEAPDYAHTYRVAVQKLKNNAWHILYSYMDGSNPIDLTPGGLIEVQPQLKPGAMVLAWASYYGGHLQIKTKSVSGGEASVLTYDGDNFNPVWSADGLRIAFESTRDGQNEIYVMNADGSNQTRLTWDVDYDGMPSWSPDGEWLAFISRRTGGYRIYILRADGSGTYGPLNEQAYSARPQWSPDGRWIFFDADASVSGFQKTHLLNLETLEVNSVSSPPVNCDHLANGWVAHRQTYSEICWISYEGQWYWYKARFFTSIDWLPGEEVDWMGSARSTDVTPPVSSLEPLPAVIGSPHSVHFSAIDADSSVAYKYMDLYDVTTGEWEAHAIPASSPGKWIFVKAGHAYHVWIQAMDWAGNLEPWPENYQSAFTVETQPPATTLASLPPFIRGEATLTWQIVDPGGSQVLCIDGQHRLNHENWTSWFECERYIYENVVSGQPGETWEYRVRAEDWAGNVEPWSGSQIAATTFYNWRIDGQVTDNTGAPLIGVQPLFMDGGLGAIPSDLDGLYAGYGVMLDAYGMTWDKTGYLSLPATQISTKNDVEKDVYLPPGDNILPDFSFESGALGDSGWESYGNLPASVEDSQSSSGAFALAMGPNGQGMAFSPAEVILNEANIAFLQSGFDAHNRMQVVWAGYGGLFAMWRDQYGAWSQPAKIASSFDVGKVLLILQDNGQAHVIYRTNGAVYYLHGGMGDNWSAPQAIFYGTYDYFNRPIIHMDPSGKLHAGVVDNHEARIYYRYKPAGGSWSDTELITPDDAKTDFNFELVVGSDGAAHVLWTTLPYDGHRLLYSRRSGSQWSTPAEVLSRYRVRFAATINTQNRLEIVVSAQQEYGGDNYVTYYRQDDANVWTTPETIPLPEYIHDRMRLYTIDAINERLILCTDTTSMQLYAVHRMPDGSWRHLGSFPYPGFFEEWVLKAGTDGSLYLYATAYNQIELCSRMPGQPWSPPVKFTTEGKYGSNFSGDLDSENAFHMLWVERDYEDYAYSRLKYAHEMLVEEPVQAGLSGEFLIPETLDNPVLSFMHLFMPGADETKFTLYADDGVTQQRLYQAPERTAGWTHAWVDMGAWRGQTVRLTFEVTAPEGVRYPFLALDDLSLGSAYPDLHLEMTSPVSYAPAGQPLPVTLRVANRGGIASEAVTLSLDLPPEMGFTSASISPQVEGNRVSWNLGTLAGGSSQTIAVQVYIKNEAAWRELLALAAQVQSTSAESQLENNEAWLAVEVNYRLFLPQTSK